MSGWRFSAWPLFVWVGLTACAAATCRPLTIEVAKKEERGRVENVSRGLYRTTETGRLEPAIAPGIVRDYWVQSRTGDWYRVTADQFDAAEVDHPIQICQ